MDKHVTYSVLANGFRKCGLYPWDPTVPRVAGHKNGIAMQNDDLHSLLKYVKQGFQFLNESMGKDKSELFEQSTVDWEENPSDRSLFLL